jgi:hypothetical protein
MDRCQARLRHDVYRFVVNGCAPELFLVMSLANIWFIRRETEGRRAFGWGGASHDKSLKTKGISSLTNWTLNSI